jgi:toluene monooxygenase system ferredoxin subunit
VTWQLVVPVDDLWSGEMRGFQVAGQPVLLIHLEGKVVAFEDRCAHQRTPLSRGRLAGRVLTCATHEWQYDAVTGRGINPAAMALTALPVEIRDGAIWVDVPAVATR